MITVRTTYNIQTYYYAWQSLNIIRATLFGIRYNSPVFYSSTLRFPLV